MPKKKRVEIVQLEEYGEMVDAKECTKCELVKALSQYNYKSNGLGKTNSRCKSCAKEYREERKDVKAKYDEKYRRENKEHISESHKKYRIENSEEIKKKDKERYRDNREVVLERNRKYREAHREEINEKQRLNYWEVYGQYVMRTEIFQIEIDSEVVDVKECTKCKEVKPLDSYINRNDGGVGNKTSHCKACLSEYGEKYREDNFEKIREINKEYMRKKREDPEFVENAKKQRRIYYYQNREQEIKKTMDWIERNKGYVKSYRKKHYEENKSSYAERWKRYFEDNKEQIRAKQRDFYNRNKEELHARWMEYYYSPKGQIASARARHTRRDREKSTIKTLTPKQWSETLDYFGHECAYCGSNQELTQDHFVPVSKGGDYTIYNIIPCCSSCNSSKQDKEFKVWYKEKKFYSETREHYILGYIRFRKRTYKETA